MVNAPPVLTDELYEGIWSATGNWRGGQIPYISFEVWEFWLDSYQPIEDEL